MEVRARPTPMAGWTSVVPPPRAQVGRSSVKFVVSGSQVLPSRGDMMLVTALAVAPEGRFSTREETGTSTELLHSLAKMRSGDPPGAEHPLPPGGLAPAPARSRCHRWRWRRCSHRLPPAARQSKAEFRPGRAAAGPGL